MCVYVLKLKHESDPLEFDVCFICLYCLLIINPVKQILFTVEIDKGMI